MIRALAITALLAGSAQAVEPVNPVQGLPTPPRTATGEVPFSEPVAPVPVGLSKWSFSMSTLVGVASPFYNKVAVWGTVRRGWGKFGAEAYGGRAISWTGAAFDVCSGPTTCTSPSGQRLGATPGNLDLLAGVSGVWRAAEGKLSMGGLDPLRFSLEASFGPALVGYRVQENVERSVYGPGARAGLGLSAGVTDSLAVRGDLLWFFYRAEIRGVPSFQRELMLGATLAWTPGRTP